MPADAVQAGPLQSAALSPRALPNGPRQPLPNHLCAAVFALQRPVPAHMWRALPAVMQPLRLTLPERLRITVRFRL